MMLLDVQKIDGRIIAWYDSELSQSIPLTVLKVEDSVYDYAMSIYATHYIDGVFQNNDDIYIHRNSLSESDLFRMSLDDLYSHSSAVKSDLTALLKRKRLTHEAYLKDTDWVKIYELEHKIGITLIPGDSSKWNIISKRQECIDMINKIDSL